MSNKSKSNKMKIIKKKLINFLIKHLKKITKKFLRFNKNLKILNYKKLLKIMKI